MHEQKITGPLFQRMVIEGARAIAEKKEQANALNVFPVPDGDTGSNLSMTMAAAMTEMQRLHTPTLGRAADAAAAALLRGARGNSGVILSLLFRGMAKRLHETEQADGRAFALALCDGVEAAYKAVMKPAEGTILTVSRVAAQHAVECCQANPALSAEEALEAVLTRGQAALAETTAQNPVLARAGVVDAGGYGLMVILSGMLDGLRGNCRAPAEPALPQAPAADFSALENEDILYPYCTEFIAQRRDKARNVERLRAILSEIGDSLVVVEDEDIVKVHVHTAQPHRVLEEGLGFGPLLTVKIENMREQHTGQVIAAAEPRERVVRDPEKEYGFVSVCAGDGLRGMFSDLGCDSLVEGGQTMNPSTSDLLDAIDATPARTVFVLPNNRNVVLAANQAAPLSEKQVIVLPTNSIPEGVAALLSFDANLDLAANRRAMEQAIAGVTAGVVTYASRNAELDGKKIKENEYLALCGGKLCANVKKRLDAVKKLAREMVKADSAFVTLIYGQGVPEEEAEKAAEFFRRENRDLEVTVIDGGQPVYFYILGVE